MRANESLRHRFITETATAKKEQDHQVDDDKSIVDELNDENIYPSEGYQLYDIADEQEEVLPATEVSNVAEDEEHPHHHHHEDEDVKSHQKSMVTIERMDITNEELNIYNDEEQQEHHQQLNDSASVYETEVLEFDGEEDEDDEGDELTEQDIKTENADGGGTDDGDEVIPKMIYRRGRGRNRNQPKPPFKCDTCGKVLSNYSSFKYHLQLHSDKTPFLCSECGQGFRTRNAYDGHMMTHVDNNPNTCKECGKSYRQAASLRCHMLTHSGVKPFQCNICGKGMTQKSGYKVNNIMRKFTVFSGKTTRFYVYFLKT